MLDEFFHHISLGNVKSDTRVHVAATSGPLLKGAFMRHVRDHGTPCPSRYVQFTGYRAGKKKKEAAGGGEEEEEKEREEEGLHCDLSLSTGIDPPPSKPKPTGQLTPPPPPPHIWPFTIA
ncbi:unnamed protein product [Pleuronectes platessa]|uniref:Uncharacterized protein n=1 Tax=Pleuronectes platessa TaxID=8262 RepID=A0A9N7VRE7_PLEPL|nr:unnamed protein product [Pleuronectes platessa]